MRSRVLDRLSRLFPEGRALPENIWRRRHRLVLILLWGHATGIALFGWARGYGLGHSVVEGGVVAIAAAAGSFGAAPRKVRAAIGSLGLLSASAILVHLSGGYIEFHFHFFVMIGLMALYQDWIPFLLAVGYVVIHHGTVGVLSPTSVYNHPDAWAHPWKWAAIHGAFVTAASLVSLATWRLNEDAQARAERILTTAGQGIYGQDPLGRCTFVNPAAARMLGYHIADLIGRPMHEVVHHTRADGSPYPAEVCPMHAALRDGAVRRVADEVFWRRDGSSFPVEYVSTPIVERGVVIGAVVTFDDITERRRVEQIVRRSEGLLAEAQTVGRIGSWEWDLGTGQIRWSDEMFRLYGYEPREFPVTFERALERVHPDDATAIRENVETAIASFQPPSREMPGIDYRVTLPTGEERVLNGRGRLMADAAGRRVRMVGTVQEVTARWRAEEEVRRLNAQLEQRVLDRTAELVEAKEESERASRAKSEFLSRMSHELRTPLNAILGFGQLLEMDKLTPDQHQSVTHILKGGQHLLALINEVLDIARIEAGRLPITVAPVRLREVVDACLRLVTPMADDQKVELVARSAMNDDPTVLADRQRLVQVLLNLLSNAVKFNRAGGDVMVSWETVEGGRLRVSVADTGRGIPPEKLARLFRPFERLEGASGDAAEGVGIGLAISKGLVELMSGAIGAESHEGVGSTFWVELPLAGPGGVPGQRIGATAGAAGGDSGP